MMTGQQAEAPVAIITGSAQGLGRAIALRLASDGYSVVVSDLPAKKDVLELVRKECAGVHPSHLSGSPRVAMQLTCDVTEEKQVEALVEETINKLGRLDVMVANAGIIKLAPLLEMTIQDLDFTNAVNVKGVLYCYRTAARAMMQSGGGRIIGACSVAGKAGFPGFGSYCMSKAAVRSLTQTAAREWGAYGITVNAYAPGSVETDMWSNDILGTCENATLLEQMVTETPATKKKTTPEQIAGLVSFLVSPAADNISGQCISIDGGWIMD